MQTSSSQDPALGENRGALAVWATWVAYHSWKVLGGVVVAIVLFGVLAMSLLGEFSDAFTIPNVESQRAYDLLVERFPQQSGDSATVVFQSSAPNGINDPASRPRIDAVLAELSALPQVVSVASPFDATYQISADGTIAYATVAYDSPVNEISLANIDKLIETVDRANGDGLVVEAGGQVVAQAEQEPPGESELLGLAAAAVILLIAFGSVVAMGLPILTAVAGLAIGFMGVGIAASVIDIPTFTPAFASMIGIGVGIDYALFVVTRFREGLADGLEPRPAVVRAVDTAGRSVIFAGGVVVISMLGLIAIGIPFVSALGISAAIVVAASIIVAVTILPAMLSLIGRRIDRWAIRLPRAGTREQGAPVGLRLAHLIQRRPWVYPIASAGFLIVLAIPLLDLEVGFPDAGANPTSTHTRRAFDLLNQGFGPGFNANFLIAIESEGALDRDAVDKLAADVQAVPGIVQVAPAAYNDTGDTAVLAVVPSTGANDHATQELVTTLRKETIPASLEGSGTKAYVGGATAVFIDLSDRLIGRTPLVFLVVIGLSFLLLTAVFRSPVIALKAALMNLLSIAAAFGVTLAVFQWGWGANLIGLEEKQPIAAFMPMFLFAILFGLSMDYEVFLLSRIREAWVHGRTTSQAVAEGLTVTARVITAAAAIMVCVFFSFMLTDDPITKQFGFGLGIAILIDATVVRLVLVPATMELLGDWNWWFPRWLDRLVPHLNIEGTTRPAIVELEPLPQAAD